MVQVFLGEALDAKIVNNQHKLGWSCHMLPEGRDQGALVVPLLVQSLIQLIMTVRARLR